MRAAAAFFAYHLRHVGSAHGDHRNEANADADRKDQERRKGDHLRIDGERDAGRQPVETKEWRGLKRPPAKAQARHTADQRQHRRFRERLPRQAGKRRAHGVARRQLADA